MGQRFLIIFLHTKKIIKNLCPIDDNYLYLKSVDNKYVSFVNQVFLHFVLTFLILKTQKNNFEFHQPKKGIVQLTDPKK